MTSALGQGQVRTGRGLQRHLLCTTCFTLLHVSVTRRDPRRDTDATSL